MTQDEALRQLPGAKSLYGSGTERRLLADLTQDTSMAVYDVVHTAHSGTTVLVLSVAASEQVLVRDDQLTSPDYLSYAQVQASSLTNWRVAP